MGLQVRTWAGPGSLSATDLKTVATPLVLRIAAPDTPIRDTARQLARAALRDALGILLARPPHEVPLTSNPGQPIRLDLPGSHIGLSVSHEPGLTLAAIHMNGAIGVDLMRLEKSPGWLSDWEQVARDYLGRQAADHIARLPQTQRAREFARAWTRLEAVLKCHDMPLQEWSAALEQALARSRTFDIDLPDGFIGTVAVYS